MTWGTDCFRVVLAADMHPFADALASSLFGGDIS